MPEHWAQRAGRPRAADRLGARDRCMVRSRRCRATPKAPGGCRTPRPRCRRRLLGDVARPQRSPTCARRPAARPRSSPPPARASPPSTARRRGSSGCGKISPGWSRRPRPSRPTSAQWQAGPFDAVLLDAPCSSTGTIRRHPDIPWLKREADIAALAALQRRLDRAGGRADQAGRHSGLLHLLARARGRDRGRARLCSRATRGCADGRSPRAEVGGLRRAGHRGRRPAHAALPSAGPRSAHGRPRRLLRRPNSMRILQRRLSARIGRRLPAVPLCVRPIAAGNPVTRACRRGASASMSRVSVAERTRLSVFLARGLLRRSVGRVLAHPLVQLAVLVRQGRPPADRAAGPAHRRRHPRDRDLCRPLRVRRQGGDLRRPLAVRDRRRRPRTGRHRCSASAGCGTCAPPNPASPAPMRARWSTNGSRSTARAIRSPGAPDVVARRIISWLSQAPLVLDDSDMRFYRRFLRSLTRQVRHLRHTASRGTRRRAAPAGRDRAHLCGAVHGRPAAPHPRRHQAAVPTSWSARSCPTAATSAAIPAR